MDSGADLYGKAASDLGAFAIAKDGSVSGTAKYVTGYTGFNPSDTNEQEGYFLPIAFNPSKDITDATMKVAGSTKSPVKMDALNVVYLGKTKTTAQKKAIEIASGKDMVQLRLSGVTFESKG